MKLKAFVFFLIIASPIYAQTFSGKIVDEFQQPIREVNILNKSNDHHTHSDEKGNFVLEFASIGDTLWFSHISFNTRQLVIESLKPDQIIVLNIKSISLNEIVISDRVNSLHLISDIDIQTSPVNSSQELLRTVPGLFIGQHAGGGKAEQMFLRGFDLDHGTDINLTVDGLPVNMVSHAHGQGYADLHYVIPETVERIDFGKGPYFENKGNFTTAGYVDFRTKQKLENSSVKLERGQFDTFRLLGMINLLDNDLESAYVATEFLASDGPFESSQNFNRINLFAKYSGLLSNSSRIGVTFSHFTSKWDASGQIPQRAVDSGQITRFGAIDDTEGGNTSRTNIMLTLDKNIDENSYINSQVFLSKYNFELYSNFTFFLDDPVNGDQIKQKENRTIFGWNSEYKKSFSLESMNGTFQAGVSLRHDQSKDNELSHTLNRSETLDQIQWGHINETNLGGYVGATLNFHNWTINSALRLDFFDFEYNDLLLPTYEIQSETKSILSPKLNIVYNQSEHLQLFFKSGKGFHSNDTRGVVAEQGNRILPAAYGMDAGLTWKPRPNMLLNAAYWYLFLEQEFVYVGDAGIVEPGGESRRQGIDLSYRFQPLPWLFLNLDTNYTLARAVDEPEGEDYIPLAPDFTLVAGVNIIHKSGLYGGIHTRYIGDRPANEDNSIVSIGYTVTDLNVGYKWKTLTGGIQILNLFDVDWNETQFATESRLQFESEPTEEIHFTPGTPFFFKAMIQYNF